METSLPAHALRSASTELLHCVAMLVERRNGEAVTLAMIARDRMVHLILHHSAAEASLLLQARSGLFGLFDQRASVDALLALPAGGAALLARRAALPPDDLRSLLTGILLQPPHDLQRLDLWLADARTLPMLMHYAVWRPKCFVDDTERSRYYLHATALCALCARMLDQYPNEMQNDFVAHVVQTLSSGVIYSCEGSLRSFAEAKATLITRFVQAYYPELTDTQFAPKPLRGDRPIRLGLLWNDVDRRTENVVGVASTRQIRRHGFEVISILHHDSYHGGVDDQPTIIEDILSLSDDVVDLNDLPKLADKCAAIRALDLDCLIFMNNITFGFNEYVALAALRLARWQAVNFCAVCTTGFPTIDLYISGDLSERAAAPDAAYTERLVRLPGTCLIFDHDHDADQRAGSLRVQVPALRDAATQTLFASGANLYKIHPALSGVWARILSATPGSRLVLYPFNPNWDLSYPIDLFERRFTGQLLSNDVDPECVTVAGPWRDSSPIEEILATADIYLDSFPHSGGLSSLDALKLGVPVVTMRGESQRENQTADMLDLLGLSRFVTASVEEYDALASRLAFEPALWAEYRAAILAAMPRARFFDTGDYSRKFAAGLREALVVG